MSFCASPFVVVELRAARFPPLDENELPPRPPLEEPRPRVADWGGRVDTSDMWWGLLCARSGCLFRGGEGEEKEENEKKETGGWMATMA
jgi:hypothetical protein